MPGSGDATAGIARAERRLATILAADVVGYSHLIEQDEDGTLSALKELRRAVIAPCLAGHYGRIVKLMGDGAIVDLGSVVDAVRCANLIQTGVAEIATAGQEAAKRKHAARCLEPAPADLGDLGQRELRIEEHSNSGRAGFSLVFHTASYAEITGARSCARPSIKCAKPGSQDLCRITCPLYALVLEGSLKALVRGGAILLREPLRRLWTDRFDWSDDRSDIVRHWISILAISRVSSGEAARAHKALTR